MRKIRRNWPKYLVIFFLNCTIWGFGIAYAAPSMWSYPNDHVLISEVHYTGAPGTGTGTEWVELYNPTNSDFNFETIILGDSEAFYAEVVTPTPASGGTITPYAPIYSRCFLYLAYNATDFYNEFNQCPDFANILDATNCPSTQHLIDWQTDEIADNDTSLCFRFDFFASTVDTVGWGNGGAGSWICDPVTNPLPNGATIGETYLRGSDAPEWIGPGGEGAETVGDPLSEQLSEVWNLSGSVAVPWEGPEVGVCRQPTAVNLLTPRARAVQNGGYMVSLLGLFGMIFTLTILIWRHKLTIRIEKNTMNED